MAQIINLLKLKFVMDPRDLLFRSAGELRMEIRLDFVRRDPDSDIPPLSRTFSIRTSVEIWLLPAVPLAASESVKKFLLEDNGC